MNSLTLSFTEWTELRSHLLQGEIEQAAIVYAESVNNSQGLRLSARTIEYLRPEDFDIQTAYHISLTDEAQSRIIKRAWDLRASIVECHSHVDPHRSARFSPSDLAGLREFVPHAWWRLRGQPYAAIVVTERDFDSLAWRNDPQTAEELSLQIEARVTRPTGLTLSLLENS